MLHHIIASSDHHRHPHSFPTRRSSDLAQHENVEADMDTVTRAREQSGTTIGEQRSTGGGTLHTENHHYFVDAGRPVVFMGRDRKSTRLNSIHLGISYAVFCLKKKNKKT